MRCNVRRNLALVCAAAIAVSIPTSLQAQWKTLWSYEGPRGPDHWGELDPEYAACNAGKAQSPIDIRTAEKADLPALQFEYRSEPLKYLINNGYTIRVNYHDAPGSGSLLAVGDKRYRLMQFHFHRPSEEYIHGKPYDMVLHLMHQADDGSVLGVAVLIKQGGANATVQQVWSHMPETKSSEEEIPGVEVNPAEMLPRDFGYYEYVGSITAPPCTEGVTWIVLKTPIELSREQIDAFAKLYPHDVRPLQPVNGRVVKESK
jgi:carbonic anhydrase